MEMKHVIDLEGFCRNCGQSTDALAKTCHPDPTGETQRGSDLICDGRDDYIRGWDTLASRRFCRNVLGD